MGTPLSPGSLRSVLDSWPGCREGKGGAEDVWFSLFLLPQGPGVALGWDAASAAGWAPPMGQGVIGGSMEKLESGMADATLLLGGKLTKSKVD